MSQPALVAYTPPGPVAADFHRSNDYVRGLLGPVGSGKSSSCCWEIMRRASMQEPDRRGVRRTRWAVIRNTYGELKTTTIKTWLEWFEGIGTMKWDPPITFRGKIGDIGDGTAMDIEVIFLALDRPEDLGKLRSLELTGGWINEASEVHDEILQMLTQRVNRFPPAPDGVGGATWTGVIYDSNFPDDDHWIYALNVEKKTETYSLYRQPGGLIYVAGDINSRDSYKPNPAAENIRNLKGGYEYYFQQLPGKSEKYIRVFILAQWGTTLSGQLVYPEWSETKHLSPVELKPIEGRTIVLSFDYGLTPACLAGQLGPLGRAVVLREWCADKEGMGIRQFYSEVVRPDVMNEFKQYRIEATGDPSGRSRMPTDERSCEQELAGLGLAVEGALTNDFLPRRDAVAYFLRAQAGDNPAFIMDPRCRMLRKGFNGGYHYARLQTSGPYPRYRDRPDKNMFSHPHDALQYLCMYLREDLNPVRAQPVQRVSAGAWS